LGVGQQRDWYTIADSNEDVSFLVSSDLILLISHPSNRWVMRDFFISNRRQGNKVDDLPLSRAELGRRRIYRVSQEECAKLRESVPYVKVHRYYSKHLYPKLNGYGDNGQRSLKL
jgi:hypothetical protein